MVVKKESFEKTRHVNIKKLEKIETNNNSFLLYK